MDVLLASIDVHTAATVLLIWLGKAIVFGTVLAVATLLLTALLPRRIRPTLEGALWTIVLIKFLIPAGPGWSISMASLCESLRCKPAVQSMLRTLSPMTSVGRIDAVVLDTHLAFGPTRAKLVDPPCYWVTLGAAAYATCVVALLGRRGRGYRRLRARCNALPVARASTRNLVVDVCGELGVRRIPVVRVSDESAAPFVMGLLHPILMLPRDQLYRREELRAVLVHEVAHLRRGDLLVRHLQRIAAVLLFFWPVVAWVNRRIDLAREYACDEWALSLGTLTPAGYARCVLNATRPARVVRLAFRPAGMASDPKNIERRVHMILTMPTRFSRERKHRRHGLLLLLCVWGGFALTGTVDAVPKNGTMPSGWPATEESVKQRAVELYILVAEREQADFNGDGVLSYLEKDSYLVALATQNADAFMEEFPYADRNHSGNLDILEAKDVIRGITLIAYADRRPDAVTEHLLPLQFCHMALDAQRWLLDNATSEPSRETLDNIWSVLKRVEERPGSYSVRMLDHGAPGEVRDRGKCDRGERSRYQELENNIAVIQAELAAEHNADKIAKLRLMLAKLEALLGELEGS